MIVPLSSSKKTGRPVQFEIMSEAQTSLKAWLDRRGGTIRDFVFPSRVDYLGHLSTRQYARLVDEWVSTIGLDRREYGAHSMRRTKASLIYMCVKQCLIGLVQRLEISTAMNRIAVVIRIPARYVDRSRE